jgi:hypothetical protein
LQNQLKVKENIFFDKKNFILLVGYDYYHRRKSSTSKCTQAGIYPDVLDCSLFHYCHQNEQHEIFKCPNGLHFDPKLFMCSAPQLVRLLNRIIEMKIFILIFFRSIANMNHLQNQQ